MNMLQGFFVNYSRLNIPVTYISETLHSSRNNGAAFPNPTLLGHSWDPALVQQVGAVIGLEARTAGVLRGYAPVLQVGLRPSLVSANRATSLPQRTQVVTDPRFGRYEEAFGEVWLYRDAGAAPFLLTPTPFCDVIAGPLPRLDDGLRDDPGPAGRPGVAATLHTEHVHRGDGERCVRGEACRRL